MAMLQENPSFQISKVMLSAKKPFSIAEIKMELARVGYNYDEHEIESTLNTFYENGVIVKIGFRYALVRNYLKVRHC